MAISVESRSIHVSDQVRDLTVATTHIPQHDKKWLDSFLSTTLSVPTWTIVHREDLQVFWQALPDYIQTEFTQTQPAWLMEDSAFVSKVLELQLADSFSHSNLDPFSPIFTATKPFAVLLDWYYSNGVRDNPLDISRWGVRDVQLYGGLLVHLSGLVVGMDSIERAAGAVEELQSQELPISYSPGLDSVTLKEVLDKGIQYVCLLPLGVGAYYGAQHLGAQEFVLAFEFAPSNGICG